MSYCYAVNSFLALKMINFGIPAELLPGVLVPNIKELVHHAQPFISSRLNIIRCGYFGGLSRQKGAHRVIELIKLSIERKLPITWSVTGSGEPEYQFQLSLLYPHNLQFYGLLSTLRFHL